MVCGGREYQNYDILANTLSDIRGKHPDMTLISGGARGADSLAEIYCQTNNVKCTVLKADWAKYGKGAGAIRNTQLLNLNPDLVIAFWDGKSKGTADSIKKAKQKGIEVRIISYEE